MHLRKSVTTAFAILLMSVPLLTNALPGDLYILQRNAEDTDQALVKFPSLIASTSPTLMGSSLDGGSYPIWYHLDNTLCISNANSSTQSNAGEVLSVCDMPSVVSGVSAFYDFLDHVNSMFTSTSTTNAIDVRLTSLESIVSSLAGGSTFNVATFMANQASTTPLIATSTFNGFMSGAMVTKLNALSTSTIATSTVLQMVQGLNYYSLSNLPATPTIATTTIRGMFSAGTGITLSSGVISVATRTETYSGITDASGNFTVTFGSSFSGTPNVQPQLINPTDNQFVRVVSRSTTGFTVNARSRTDVIGLLPAFANLSGATVDVSVIGR